MKKSVEVLNDGVELEMSCMVWILEAHQIVDGEVLELLAMVECSRRFLRHRWERICHFPLEGWKVC